MVTQAVEPSRLGFCDPCWFRVSYFGFNIGDVYVRSFR